jgi:hypothetical protein
MKKELYYKVYDQKYNLILVTPVWKNVIEKLQLKVEEDLILSESNDWTTKSYSIKKVLL